MRYRSFVPRLGLAYVRVLAGLQFVMFFGGQEFKPGLAETLYHVMARNFPRTHLVFVLRLRCPRIRTACRVTGRYTQATRAFTWGLMDTALLAIYILD